MGELPIPLLVGIGGLIGGMALGAAGRWARFCTLAAIEDATFSGNFDRLRAWALAVAIAIAITSIGSASGLVNLWLAGVLQPTFALFGWIFGGILFGFGMSQVGTCGFGALVRLGGGDLRAIVVVVVMGVVAYAVGGGVLAFVRQWFVGPLALPFAEAETLRLPDLLGLSEASAGFPAAVLAIWALGRGNLWQSPKLLPASIIFGLVIGGGWWLNGAFGQLDPFELQLVQGYTYVYPLGHTLIALMTSPLHWLDFGTGAVLGVVIGSAIVSLKMREFRWEACDDAVELRRHLVGAAAMGAGGVLAFGCTIGQGMTAAAALSVSAPIVFASIALGAWLGLQLIVEGSVRPALNALLRRQ